eukprot:gene7203-9668_t
MASKLPVNRVKAIMQKDPDVKMVSSEAVVLITKATELFIAHSAQASFIRMQQAAPSRKTIQLRDLEHIRQSKEEFLFLEGIDLAPKTKRSESLAFTRNEPENVEGHVDTSEEALPSPDEITNDHIDQGGIDDS